MTKQLKQLLPYLPPEIYSLLRFFPVKGKTPLIKGWQKPENQRQCSACSPLAGFDICGHGQGDDYLVIDFDHVLDEEGKFISDNAKKLFEYLAGMTYTEVSISGRGLHAVLKPTPNKFSPMTGRNGHSVIKFEEGGGFAEMFYRSQGRYFLLTGQLRDAKKPLEVLSDNDADNVIEYLLSCVTKDEAPQDKAVEKSTQDKPKQSRQDKPLADDPSYDNFRAERMLRLIDPSALTYTDWLSVISACKNIGLSYGLVDDFNKRDPSRYDAAENLKRWNSLNDPSFGIVTLHGVAKKFNYSEKETYAEYHRKQANNVTNDETSSINADRNLREILFAEKSALDRENAARFAGVYGNVVRYVTDDDAFATYSGGLWTIGRTDSTAILAPLYSELSATVNRLANLDNKAETAIATTLSKARNLSGATLFLKGNPSLRITRADFDNHETLLPCLNGVIDLESGKLYDCDPKFLWTKSVNAKYHEDAESEVVDNFLASILPSPNVREAFLRFIGYSLSASVKEHKFLLLSGGGGNGKSTMLGAIQHLMNDWCINSPPEMILEDKYGKDANAATPAVGQLVGRRLAIIQELPQKARLDASKIKNLTGGDSLYYRRLHHEAEVLKNPSFKLVLCSNYLPSLLDANDYGMRRRMVVVPFSQSFRGKDVDTELPSKLKTPQAMSRLLKILVDQAIQYHREGLFVPSAVENATESYFMANDWLATFIEENCEFDENANIPRRVFLSKIRQECAEAKQLPDNEITNMVKKLKNVRYDRATSKGAYAFCGLKWRDDKSSPLEYESVQDSEMPFL